MVQVIMLVEGMEDCFCQYRFHFFCFLIEKVDKEDWGLNK